MSKILGSKSMTQPRQSEFGVSNDSKAECNSKYKLYGNKIDVNEVDSNQIGDNEVKKKCQKTTKSKKLFESKKTITSLDFLTLRARLTFIKLRQVFIKAPIPHHFDQKHHILVKADISGYIIGGILSQVTLNDFGQ